MAAVNFDWDEIEDNIDEEFDDAGNSTAEYTTEPERYGNIISQYRDGVTSTFHHDGIGSTVAVTNESGGPTATRAYTSFGETTESSGTLVFPFQFVGQRGYYFDESTQDYNVRHRVLEPSAQRWSTLDPFDSTYVYCENSPTARIDPSGLQVPAVQPVTQFAPSVKVIAASASGCVHEKFEVKFGIPWDKVGRTGFLVQHISTATQILDCNDNDITAQYTERTNEYWEAFDMDHIWLRSKIAEKDDAFGFDFNDTLKTKGTRKVKGTVKGFAKLQLPSYFVPKSVDEALELPATRTKPDLDMTNGTPHNLTLTWDCCCTPTCRLMYTDPRWAIDVIDVGGTGNCPVQIPSFDVN
jgi:RHS repeat-associated protein